MSKCKSGIDLLSREHTYAHARECVWSWMYGAAEPPNPSLFSSYICWLSNHVFHFLLKLHLAILFCLFVVHHVFRNHRYYRELLWWYVPYIHWTLPTIEYISFSKIYVIYIYKLFTYNIRAKLVLPERVFHNSSTIFVSTVPRHTLMWYFSIVVNSGTFYVLACAHLVSYV